MGTFEECGRRVYCEEYEARVGKRGYKYRISQRGGLYQLDGIGEASGISLTCDNLNDGKGRIGSLIAKKFSITGKDIYPVYEAGDGE